MRMTPPRARSARVSTLSAMRPSLGTLRMYLHQSLLDCVLGLPAKLRWTWEGGSSVKSFANVALDFTSEKLSSFSKIVATWSWSYSYSGTMVSDVAFDMFTSSSADGDSEYEIMVWLAAYGDAGPISSTGEAIHTVTLGGYAFKLYSGSNGDTTVYSFVAEETISDFYADLMTFFTYLIGEDLISSSQYLTTIEAGTEPTTYVFKYAGSSHCFSAGLTYYHSGSDAELTSSYSCVIESS